MLKALAIKELREIAWIAAIALACFLAQVGNLMGMRLFSWLPFMSERSGEVPFLGGVFLEFFTLVSIVFTIALGFRQSAWESGRGTYLFLLHRPLRREVIFLTKLAIGGGLFWVCAAVPILLYGWWAATPGNHPSPFEWSMTSEAWAMWLVLPMLYLGAFLSGLRPARWLGTRLLPLVACGMLTMLLYSIPWWWIMGLPLTLLLYVLLIIMICYVAGERDY